MVMRLTHVEPHFDIGDQDPDIVTDTELSFFPDFWDVYDCNPTIVTLWLKNPNQIPKAMEGLGEYIGQLTASPPPAVILSSLVVWFDTETDPLDSDLRTLKKLPYFEDIDHYGDSLRVCFRLPTPDLIPDVEDNLRQFLGILI
jgi:hypothetical protein